MDHGRNGLTLCFSAIVEDNASMPQGDAAQPTLYLVQFHLTSQALVPFHNPRRRN